MTSRARIQARSARAEAVEAKAARQASGGRKWSRWLTPALGVAAVAVMVALPRGEKEGATLAANDTVEDAVSMTFRSDADGVTIHWIN